VTAPASGTTNSLVVDFQGPMNYSLLLKTMQVMQGRGNVPGKVALDHHEAEWRLTPDSRWQAGNCQLVVDTGIEDLAGNHIGAAFVIDIFEAVSKTIERRSVTIPFRIR
jgi:hypothetical protein